MKYLLLLWCISSAGSAVASDSLVLHSLQRIYHLQPRHSGVFPAGSIPSYRLYALNGKTQKADINAFFTGLTAFTLRDINPQFADDAKLLANRIMMAAAPVYDKFKNRKGRNTYNFWPTDTPQIFPHSGWMNWFDKTQALPDDLDDTVILLLAMNAPDSVAAKVHAIMQAYTNRPGRSVNNTFSPYRSLGAYSTWFGEKMPVDFDICVLSNVLYFVQAYNLPWTSADSASLQLIERILTDRRHVSSPAYVSPHYSKTSIILYHLSRLMSAKPIASLEQYRPQLVEDARKAFENADSFMEEVILSTALLKWGVTPPQGKAWKAGGVDELVEDERFSFFIANMASMLPDLMKRSLNVFGKFYYYAPAYNHVLFLENLAWRRKRGLPL